MSPLPTGPQRTAAQNDQALSRRERQMMDIVYAHGQATATEVLEGMADAPSRDTVRTILRILERKGHLTHHKQGREFVYKPTASRARAARSALQRVLRTFFEGSVSEAVALHLISEGSRVTPKELDRLSGLIRQARKRQPKR